MNNVVRFPSPSPAGDEVSILDHDFKDIDLAMVGEKIDFSKMESRRSEDEAKRFLFDQYWKSGIPGLRKAAPDKARMARDAIDEAYRSIRDLSRIFGHDGAACECGAIIRRLRDEGYD